MVLRRAFFISLFLLWTTTSHAEDTYKVVYVYDGDTVKVRSSKREFKLRLAEIDAPERNQDYGLKSRRALIKLCQGNDKLITVQMTGTDQYNRTLGNLQCNHVDVSRYLTEHGFAWHYAQYSNNSTLHHAELNARQQKLGLWSNNNPTPPWVWRHKQMHH